MPNSRRLVLAAVVIGSAAVLSASTVAAAESAAERVSRLRTQVDGYRAQMRDIGNGETSPRLTMSGINARLSVLRGTIERVEQAAGRAGVAVTELDATRKKFEETSIFSSGDVAQEAGEKAAEAAAKKALSKAAGGVLSALSVAVDVVDYGGRKVIKSVNVAALEELVKQQRAQHLDLIHLVTMLYHQLGDEHDKLRKMEDLWERYKAARLELYQAQEAHDKAQKELAKAQKERDRLLPARSKARTDRVVDREGDREEAAKLRNGPWRNGPEPIPSGPPFPKLKPYPKPQFRY